MQSKHIQLISLFLFLNTFHLFSFNVNIKTHETEKQISWDEALDLEFETTNQNIFQHTFSKSTFWIKIEDLPYGGKEDVIHFSNTHNNRETLFFINDGELLSQFNFGTDQRYETSTLLPHFEIPEACDVILIKIESETFFFQSFNISSKSSFDRINTAYTMLVASVVSIFLFLIFYVGILYRKSNRHVLKVYFFYVLNLFIGVLFISNIGRYFFWNDLPFSNSYLEGTILLSLIGIYTWLTLVITEIKYEFPKLDKVVRVFILLLPALIIIGFFTSPNLISLFANIAPGFGQLLILTCAILAYVKKHPNAGIYLIGNLAFIAGTFVRLLINWNVIPYSFFAEIVMYLGILTEIFLFLYVVLRHVEKKFAIFDINKQRLEEHSRLINELRLELNLGKETLSPISTEINESINNYLLSPLSKREIEVLGEMAKGKNYNAISEDLFISINTLKTHISRIYSKLGTKNRIEAINKALELNEKKED